MLAAVLHRFPALRDLRVQFAALAFVTALPFVAGAAYDIWFAMQTTSGSILPHAGSDVIEVRIGGLAIALMVSGLLAGLILHRMMPARADAVESTLPRELRALNALLERRVEQRTRELERSMRELEAYSYAISNNLQSPLRAIDASTVLIERHAAAIGAEGGALLRRLREGVQRMAGMLEALAEHARLGRRRLVVQAVEMGDVVKLALEEMRLPDAERERVALASLPAVPADAALLGIAWRALIDNALKFSHRARDRRVQIEGEVRRGFAEFRVTDAGAGFDPAQAGKLFNLFERLHREEDYPGLGAGLALVKRIVERHGGFVWADGTPGKGATFGFALPLAGRS
jgi:light-regulated signal transduction histidine kinase (bacteriophytochrome)